MEIRPTFDVSLDSDLSYKLFIQSVSKQIGKILPSEILDLKDDPELFLGALSSIVPLVCWSQMKEGGKSIAVTILCNGEYSHGSGRFISDVLSRRLIPGKIVELVGTRTLSFRFFSDSSKEFLFNERWIVAENHETLELIYKALPQLMQEVRLTLLSMFKIRHFLSIKSESAERLSDLMQEMQHLSSFEQLHGIIQRQTAEKTLAEIRAYIEPLYKKRPLVFDRDIFEEIKPFVTQYNEQFIGSRPMPYIARLICYHYYFKMKLENHLKNEPLVRHVLLRLFRNKHRVGMMIALNLFGENEILKQEHLIEVIKINFPFLEKVKGSFFIDKSIECRPILYLEMERENGQLISSNDIQLLRANLVSEIKECIHSLSNPLFMLRNDEDQMRYMISLSRELRFVRDIPQIAITFEEQTTSELSFSVIFLRVLKKGLKPIRELLDQLPFKTQMRDLKMMGVIRNKYPKEGAIFKVSLVKSKFLRRDRSLDLLKTRLVLLEELRKVFNEVRDYNGGLIAKQLEILHTLKSLLKKHVKQYDFSIENFFFSLEPMISQTTLNPLLLQEGFLNLLEMVNSYSPNKIHVTEGGVIAGYIAESLEKKDRLIYFIDSIKENFLNLAYTLTHLQNIFCFTIFLPDRDEDVKREFIELLQSFEGGKVESI